MFSDLHASPWPGEHLATVGVFDGVHLGHRAILTSMIEEARRLDLPALVVTFHPRPVTVFAPDTPPDELTPAPRKWRLLAEVGADRVSVLRFSRTFAQMEPEEFLTVLLGAGDGLRGLWVGHDFRFGRRRRGGWDMIEAEAARRGFRAVRVGPVMDDGRPISSTRVRECLRDGAIGEATRLLGRAPDIEGIVVSGRGQGAKVLVATANLALPETQCLPAPGVYAGFAEWDGAERLAVMNLGRRPTLTAGDRLVPEVHVLDFEGDLRGRRLLFRMVERLREERKFASLQELRDQVAQDVDQARRSARRWIGESQLVHGA